MNLVDAEAPKATKPAPADLEEELESGPTGLGFEPTPFAIRQSFQLQGNRFVVDLEQGGVYLIDFNTRTVAPISRDSCSWSWSLGHGVQAQGDPAALPVGETGGANGGAASRGTGCRADRPASLPVLLSPKLGGSRSEARPGRSPKPRPRARPNQCHHVIVRIF